MGSQKDCKRIENGLKKGRMKDSSNAEISIKRFAGKSGLTRLTKKPNGHRRRRVSRDLGARTSSTVLWHKSYFRINDFLLSHYLNNNSNKCIQYVLNSLPYWLNSWSGKDYIRISRVEPSSDQIIKPINTGPLTKWVGKYADDIVR